MSAIQHPYGEGDAITEEKDMPSMAKDAGKMRGYTGYIGVFPALSK